MQRVPYVGIDGSETQFSVDQQRSAWTRVFPPDTVVNPYQQTFYHDRPVVTFPASETGDQVRAAYGQSSNALANGHRGDPTQLRTSLRAVNDAWRTGLSSPNQARGDSPLQQAYNFYRRPDAGQRQSSTDSPGQDVNEFHSIVARLADHPMLLRALGLLIDVAVPASRLGPSAASATLSVQPGWPTPDPHAPVGWANAVQEDLSPTCGITRGFRCRFRQ